MLSTTQFREGLIFEDENGQLVEIIEFQPNQIIHIRKLEKAGVTKEMLREFSQQVYEYIEEN